MATSHLGKRQVPNSTKDLSTPLTYSEYTEEALRVLPPNIVMPEHISSDIDNINRTSSNSSSSTNNPRMKAEGNCKLLMTNQNTIVIVNVTGTRFEVSSATYSKIKSAILKSGDTTFVQINPSNGCPEIFVERHPASFAAILDYHRCGELHMPNDICPSVFKRELKYWQIQSREMEHCCLRRYAAFHSNEKTLSDCHLSFHQWNDSKTSHPPTKWGRIRKRGWAIMDDPKSGPLAKVYLCVATFFVVLSIFLLAASSDPTFNRELNADEWEEFMSSDELYNYWDRIYPGKQRPERTQPDVSNTTPQSFGSGHPTSGGGIGKRSLPDDPRYVIQGQKEGEITSTGKEDVQGEELLQRIVHDFESQNTHDESEKKQFDRTGYDERQSNEGSLSAILPFYIREGVKIMINKLHKNKNAEDIETMTQTVVDEAMGNRKKRLEKLMEERNGGGFTEDTSSNLQRDNGHGDHPTNKQDGENNIPPNSDPPSRENNYNGDDNPLPYDVYGYDSSSSNRNDQIMRMRRHRRSAGNGTGGWNDTRTLDDYYNQNCLRIAGSDLHTLIDALTLVALTLGDYDELPPAKIVYSWVDILDKICMAYFTVEFIMRIVFTPNLCQFFLSFVTVMDIIALLTMYTAIIVDYLIPEMKYTESAMDAVNCFQITRVFRFFRLVKDVTGFRVLLLSVRTSWRELVLLLLYIVMAVTIFATIVFFCERENMKSIPESAWWAIVTMTTVGYGDITPKSLQGRLTGMACAMSGVLLIAVTVPIFVNNFILFYEYFQIDMDGDSPDKIDKNNEKNSGVGYNATKDSERNGKNNPNNNNNGKKQARANSSSSPESPSSKFFRESSCESSVTDIALDSVTTPTSPPPSWSSNRNQAFEMDSSNSNNSRSSSIISRTNSSKSLLSQNQNRTSGSRGRHSSSISKDEEVTSAVSMSKVTPFVYDLELEKENGDKTATGKKPGVKRNNKRNSKPNSMA